MVEDTIELYVLDTTMRKSILKGKEGRGPALLDAMSDLDEARTYGPVRSRPMDTLRRRRA